MQSEGEEEISTLDNQVEAEPELSEAWRMLLGLDAQADDQQGSQDGHKASGRPQGSPLLANDPWSHLVQTQGVQVVDLQQVRLHAAHVPLSDIDVERVLKMMQEAPSQYDSQE